MRAAGSLPINPVTGRDPSRGGACAPRLPPRVVAGFALAWISFFAILFWLPMPAGLSGPAKAALATAVWSALIWMSDAVPAAVSGIMIPAILLRSGAVPTFAASASGFAAPVFFLCVSAFVFSAVMQLAGLDRRIALFIIHRFRARTANGVIWSFFGVNILLSLIVPAANARSAALLPVVNGVTALFGDTAAEGRAKKAIVIQTLVYGSMISGMCILTAHLPNLVIAGLLDRQLGLHLSYLDWLKLQCPYLGMFVLTQLWVQFYFKSRAIPIPGGRETIAHELAALPAMTGRHRGILAVLVFVAGLWATESMHGISTESVAMIGLALMFIPGLLDLRWKDIQERTMWGTLLLLAGALSLSSAISSSGLAPWLADQFYPLASGHAWWSTLLIVMLATHVIRLGMLSNIAAVTMFAPILLDLALKLGLHPVAFTLLVSDTDSFAYLLPTQITAAVIAYSSGTFTMSDYAKVGVISVALAILYGVFVMAPWYAYLGFPIWKPAAPWPLGYGHG